MPGGSPKSRRERLRRRIGVHDQRQFELKLEYRPSADERWSRYVVEMFVCMPGSLNVTSETVPIPQLYADVRNYVRLKTPEFVWAELVEREDSPLNEALRAADRLLAGKKADRFVYACKLFASVFRGALRSLTARVDMACGGGQEALSSLSDEVEHALAGAYRALDCFRSLQQKVAEIDIERAQAAYRLADEFTSLSIEQALRSVIAALEHAGVAAAELKEKMFAVILKEDRHRSDLGYPTRLSKDSDNEEYLHRASLLKKYCSSALFLQIHREAPSRHWQELLFAVAAGIAMAFATVIAFWAQAGSPNLGLRLFLILIVAYMFKDRIKEGFRALFAAFLQRSVYDWKIRIDDPAGGVLGSCREKMEFLSSSKLPPDVYEIRQRNQDSVVRIAEAELRESCYRYRKEIKLNARRVREHGQGVTDIVRFNIARLLEHMDEPDQQIDWVDLDSRKVTPVRANKVYHVDVVFRFESRKHEAPRVSLLRLILNRRGIKRIERLE